MVYALCIKQGDKLTLISSPLPSHFPVAAVVALVEDSPSMPTKTGKTQVRLRGSQPNKAFPRELFPTPIAPIRIIVGL